MGILFAITVLALLALLWATVGIAQHVRRARRRRRREGTEEGSAGSGIMGLSGTMRARSAAEVSFLEVTPYNEAAVARPPRPQEEVVISRPGVEADATKDVPSAATLAPNVPVAPDPQEVVHKADVSPGVNEQELPLESGVAEVATAPSRSGPPVGPATSVLPAPIPEVPYNSATELKETVPDKIAPAEPAADAPLTSVTRNDEPLTRWAFATPFHASPAAAEVSLRSAAAAEPADARPLGSTSAVAKTADPASEARAFPPPLRPVHPRHGLAALQKKMERTDWAYFNKDLGDLTDPYESPRSKSKERPRAD